MQPAMYTEYFGLTEEPFTIAANPRFLYMSSRHREALAHLMYGLGSDCGFVLLTGEVGTGKTTVCRCLLEQLPETTDVAFILNPKLTVPELLAAVCDELHVDYPPGNQSIKVFVDAINRHLLASNAAGRNTVLLIDEAQNLNPDVLEQLRLLTNLETNERKLLRIVLIGQPELDQLLTRPELRQLNQRITARYHLKPLLRAEVGGYITHRLAVAGAKKRVFSPRVLGKLHRRTGGVPRLINMICDRAMLGAYTKAQHTVDGQILGKAAKEVHPPRPAGTSRVFSWSLSAAAMLLLAAVATAAVFYTEPGRQLAALVVSEPPPAAIVAEHVSAPEAPTEASTVSGSPLPAAPTPIDEPVALPATASEAMPDEAVEPPQAVSATTPPSEVVVSTIQFDPTPEPSPWPEPAVASAGTSQSAYASLFEQWGLDLRPDVSDPCAQALRQGLRCYAGSGNLGSLGGLDRPAVLTLRDPQGRDYYATLTGLDEHTATLVLGDKHATVVIRDLESRWLGEYVLLWRPPPLGYGSVRPGTSGEHVAWLADRLARVPGTDPALRGQRVFDTELVEIVKEFQRSRGLVADGIAGRLTVIRLNTVTDPSVPRIMPASAPLDSTG